MTIYQVDPQRIERNWNAITAELDVPTPSIAERMLGRIGLPAHMTRLALATPSLRRIWFAATVLVVVIGLASADSTQTRDAIFTFLIIAPLLPLLGVAMAYGTEADPAHEIGLATPIRGLRLVLTRTVVVLVCSALALAVVAVFSGDPMALAWLLPGLALTLLSLAGSTITSPRRSAAAVGGAWLTVALVLNGAATDPVSALLRPGQALSILTAAAAGVVIYQRRNQFDFVSDAT